MRILWGSLLGLVLLMPCAYAQVGESFTYTPRLMEDDIPFLSHDTGDYAFSDMYIGDTVVVYEEWMSNTDDLDEEITIEGSLIVPGEMGYVSFYHPLVITGSMVTGAGTIACFSAPVKVEHDLHSIGDICFDYSVTIKGTATVVHGNLRNQLGKVEIGALNMTGFAQVNSLHAAEVFALRGVVTVGDFIVDEDFYGGSIDCGGDLIIGYSCDAEWVDVAGRMQCGDLLARELVCDGDVVVAVNMTVINGMRCDGVLDCGGDIISGVKPLWPVETSIICKKLVNGNVKYGGVRETAVEGSE